MELYRCGEGEKDKDSQKAFRRKSYRQLSVRDVTQKGRQCTRDNTATVACTLAPFTLRLIHKVFQLFLQHTATTITYIETELLVSLLVSPLIFFLFFRFSSRFIFIKVYCYTFISKTRLFDFLAHNISFLLFPPVFFFIDIAEIAT